VDINEGIRWKTAWKSRGMARDKGRKTQTGLGSVHHIRSLVDCALDALARRAMQAGSAAVFDNAGDFSPSRQVECALALNANSKSTPSDRHRIQQRIARIQPCCKEIGALGHRARLQLARYGLGGHAHGAGFALRPIRGSGERDLAIAAADQEDRLTRIYAEQSELLAGLVLEFPSARSLRRIEIAGILGFVHDRCGLRRVLRLVCRRLRRGGRSSAGLGGCGRSGIERLYARRTGRDSHGYRKSR